MMRVYCGSLLSIDYQTVYLFYVYTDNNINITSKRGKIVKKTSNNKITSDEEEIQTINVEREGYMVYNIDNLKHVNYDLLI